MNLQTLLRRFDAIIFFDTETSGLDALTHQIIELAAIRVECSENGIPKISDSMDYFVKLPEGEHLDQKITDLTGITDEILEREGTTPKETADRFHQLIAGTGRRILLAAQNAQFDLLFIRQLLKGHRLGVELEFLDTLTVYKDRAPYPHKLEDAIRHYKLENKVKNSHRAIDDTCALLEVTKAMDAEREDLHTYINIFGYNPKYGVSGEKISGVKYYPQRFHDAMTKEAETLPALFWAKCKVGRT